jgi:hypothetical protein
MSICAKPEKRDPIEVAIASKCGFYIRGEQQGLAEPEISLPILMTRTLHEMMVQYAEEIVKLTKAHFDIDMKVVESQLAAKSNELELMKRQLKTLIGDED